MTGERTQNFSFLFFFLCAGGEWEWSGMEMAKDKREMGEVWKQEYLCTDRTVYLFLAKINLSIQSL